MRHESIGIKLICFIFQFSIGPQENDSLFGMTYDRRNCCEVSM